MILHFPDAALSWVRLHPRPDLLRLIERLHQEEATPALALPNAERLLRMRARRLAVMEGRR
jgi:hypothetical protein